jgi:oligogalacturonide lyase
LHAAFVEAGDNVSRLRLLNLAQGAAATVVEAQATISHPVPRPRRTGLLYRRGGTDLWLVNYDGRDNRQLKLAPGRIGPAHWAPNGRSILYLSIPEDSRKLNEIREHVPDSNADQGIASTSQFASLAANGDVSVFAGASSSKASPYVLLLLRVTHRELALCEHKCSDPAKVVVAFSRDSQRVYFVSDRHGKFAIYSIRVDRLVEKTET